MEEREKEGGEMDERGKQKNKKSPNVLRRARLGEMFFECSSSPSFVPHGFERPASAFSARIFD
jgi:hypothetical protein